MIAPQADTVRTLTVRHPSQNAKTGPVAVSTFRTIASCPPDCVLYAITPDGSPSGPCYAANGRPGAQPFAHAARGLTELDILRQALAGTRPGDVIRFNVSGDYLRADGEPDREYIDATNATPTGRTVLSYTHAWKRMRPEWFADHVRPNASCDTVADLRQALAAGWSAVMVQSTGRELTLAGTVEGRKAVQCPNETTGRQCISCKLCAQTQRPSVVVFTAHGTQKRKASTALESRRSMEDHAA